MKYFLKVGIPNLETDWREVTYEEYVDAEKRAGFVHIAQDKGGTATAGFSGNNISGRIEYTERSKWVN